MLSKKQFDILETLATKGNLSQRGLAEATSQSVGNVNRLVKELSTDGLVEDRRITARGLEPAFPQHSTIKSWHRCRKLVDFL